MNQEKLLENAIAISGEFHTNRRYEKFYGKHCDFFGGFIGIYGFIQKAAIAFTKVETELQIEFDGRWIDCVVVFTKWLFDNHSASEAGMKEVVNKIIEEVM